MRINLILFDLDDTLGNNSGSKSKVFEHIYNSNSELQQISLEEFIQKTGEARDTYLAKFKDHGFNTYSRIDLWMELLKEIDVYLTIAEIKDIIDIYWEYSIRLQRPFEGLIETLRALRKKDIIIGVLTGGDFYSKSKKLMDLKIDHLIDYLFPSELTQSDKNTGDVYKYVLEFLDIDASETIMVGDKPDQDIEPANKVGITTVQALMRGDQPVAKSGYEKPDYTIKSLPDMLDIIKRINN